MRFPGASDSKESACNAGDPCSIPGSGRSPGGGHGNPLQYPCLENPMDTGAWGATVHGVTKSQTRLKRVDTYTHIADTQSCLRLSCTAESQTCVCACTFFQQTLSQYKLLRDICIQFPVPSSRPLLCIYFKYSRVSVFITNS